MAFHRMEPAGAERHRREAREGKRADASESNALQRYPRNVRLNFSLRDSSHQGHEPTAAAYFELAEDRVEMLFHHRQTQTGVISDLLVAPPFTDKSRNFLFAPGESHEMRQTGARRRPRGRSSVTAQILALDKKMRPRHASRNELFQMERCSQLRRSGMMHLFFPKACQP